MKRCRIRAIESTYLIYILLVTRIARIQSASDRLELVMTYQPELLQQVSRFRFRRPILQCVISSICTVLLPNGRHCCLYVQADHECVCGVWLLVLVKQTSSEAICC